MRVLAWMGGLLAVAMWVPQASAAEGPWCHGGQELDDCTVPTLKQCAWQARPEGGYCFANPNFWTVAADGRMVARASTGHHQDLAHTAALHAQKIHQASLQMLKQRAQSTRLAKSHRDHHQGLMRTASHYEYNYHDTSLQMLRQRAAAPRVVKAHARVAARHHKQIVRTAPLYLSDAGSARLPAVRTQAKGAGRTVVLAENIAPIAAQGGCVQAANVVSASDLVPCPVAAPVVRSVAVGPAPRVKDPVPVINVAPGCRFAATGSPRFEHDVEVCTTSETEARAQLERKWADFASADRTSCTRATTIGGGGTYTSLLTCLEIRADLHGLPKDASVALSQVR
jgi:hypothetical protein